VDRALSAPLGAAYPEATLSGMRTYLTFLDLLVREAAAVEFEGPVLEARAANLPAEQLDELDRPSSPRSPCRRCSSTGAAGRPS